MQSYILTWVDPTELSNGSTPPSGDMITNVTVADLTSGTPVVIATLTWPAGSPVPTSYTWTPAAAGTYTLGVAVTDSNDQLSAYDTATVTVTAPTPPPFAAPTGLTIVPAPAPTGT